MIRENPASRGTETSAEDLVGPPGRMVSNAGQQQWYGGYPCTHSRRRPNGSLRPVITPYPFPSASSVGVGRHRIGGARGLGNLVRPESHPEPRGFPVQWADPGVKPAIKSSDRPVRPRPRARPSVLPRVDRTVRTVSPAVCSHVRRAIVCACLCVYLLTDA